MALLSSAKHEGLVNAVGLDQHTQTYEGMVDLLPQASSLSLRLLEPGLQLLLRHLEVLDVGSRPVQERDLARLLVRHGKGILKAAVAIAQLIAAALLRLDALAADLLTTDIVVGEVAHARLEVVVVVAVNVRTPRAPLRLARRHAGDVHRVEAMRAGDGRN